MTTVRPQREGQPIGGEGQASVRVLRDVVLQGQVSPGRPRSATVQTPRVPVEAPVRLAVQRTTAAGEANAAAPVSVPAAAHAAPERDQEAGYRRGHEEGLAKGLAEGREKAADEARQAAEMAARKAQRELAERTENLNRELTQQAQVAYQARVEVLAQLIEALPQQVEERLAVAEEDMLALSFEAVCRVLGDHVVTANGLRAQLLQSMRAMRGRRLVAVHLHPDDLATLQREPGAVADVLANEAIEWVADAEMTLGGCIVRSPEGGLDARLDTQLGALRELLLRSRAAPTRTPSSGTA